MDFTGDDPPKRLDLFTLIRKSVALGPRSNLTSGATPLLTHEATREIKIAGVERLAIKLDGWDCASCEMRALEAAWDIGLDTQVQTTVTAANSQHLDEIADLVEQVKARAWALALEGNQSERVFRTIYEISQRASFEVKTEDRSYHQYLAGRLNELGEVPDPAWYDPMSTTGERGFIFISHTGEIHPAVSCPCQPAM